MRAPWTDFSEFSFDLGVALNSLPHTTQRVALSDKRVPQVGHSLVVVDSGLIVLGLYHEAYATVQNNACAYPLLRAGDIIPLAL
jgi:hypothetical protein